MKTDEPITLNELALKVVDRTGILIPNRAEAYKGLRSYFEFASMLLEIVDDCVLSTSAASLTRMTAAYAAHNNDTDETASITIDVAAKLAKLIADVRLYSCQIPTYCNVCDAMASLDE